MKKWGYIFYNEDGDEMLTLCDNKDLAIREAREVGEDCFIIEIHGVVEGGSLDKDLPRL